MLSCFPGDALPGLRCSCLFVCGWLSSLVFGKLKTCCVGLGSGDWLGQRRRSNFFALRNPWVGFAVCFGSWSIGIMEQYRHLITSETWSHCYGASKFTLRKPSLDCRLASWMFHFTFSVTNKTCSLQTWQYLRSGQLCNDLLTFYVLHHWQMSVWSMAGQMWGLKSTFWTVHNIKAPLWSLV